jgi:S1-C subfamily serine protease
MPEQLFKMNIFTVCTAIVFFYTLIPGRFSFAAENASPVTDATIVEIIATCQEFDPRIPWRNKPPQIRQGLGVVIEGNHILTIDNIARNSTLIEIRRAKTGAKLEAKAVVSDEQAGIALLKLSDEKASSQFRSVPLADKVQRDDLVQIVKLDASGQLQSDEGRVIEVTSSPRGLLVKVLTDLSIEKNGAPIFIGGKLAGIILQYDKNTQTCTALAGTTLKNIVAAAMTPPYEGIAWAGMTWEPLLDPAKRKYLGADQHKGGILVVRTAPGSGAAAVLQTEDVITEIDGFQLDEMGYYADPDFGRLLFSHVVNGRHKPGDEIPLAVIRNRQKITLKMPLKRQSDIAQVIPDNTSGARAEYLADGGFVLRELSGDYLRAAGNEWIIQINPRLVNYYFNPWQFSVKDGDHIVILSMVLPDLINIGYHEYRDEVVTAVNGEKIRSLDDVFRIVERDGLLKRVSIMGYEVDLVLDEAEMAQANKRIAANYRIQKMRFKSSKSDEK